MIQKFFGKTLPHLGIAGLSQFHMMCFAPAVTIASNHDLAKVLIEFFAEIMCIELKHIRLHER